MKTYGSRAALCFLAVVLAVPLFAATGADITIPIGGYLKLPNDLTYRTEITITNNRDAQQYVMISMVADGHDLPIRAFPLAAHETKFLAQPFPTSSSMQSNVGAIHVIATQPIDSGSYDPPPADPAGQIEVNAFVVAERGRFRASSRQEVAGIPSSDYRAKEEVFLGVRHDLPTYTNVGIVNLDPTETVTFFVEFQYLNAFAVTVPPLSLRQVRIPGDGNAGRWVRVYPEWGAAEGTPSHTTPWVAYASTVDGYTGDAFSGMRVPASSVYTR